MNSSNTNRSGFDPFSGPPLEVIIPLTDSQKEIWIATKIDSKSSLGYIESLSVSIKGDIDLKALVFSINSLIQRHEILRSTISPDGTNLYVISNCNNPPSFQDINVDGLKIIINEEMNQPFDLINGPLFRSRILSHDKHFCTLIFSAHHIICDGWSLDVILSELSILYNSYINPNQSVLIKPAPKFSDYASILYKQIQAEIEQCENYWKKMLNGRIPDLDLPVDFKRPDTRTYRAESTFLQCENKLVKSLRNLSTKNKASLFVTFLTAWAATLSRITKQTDIIIGVPAAGQPDIEMENLVGHCVSFLPIRIIIKHSDTFSVLLQRVKTSLYGAYEHRKLSFGRLLQIINTPRNPSRIPLVSTSLTHTQKYALDKIRFDKCSIDYSLNPRSHEIFEINLNAIESTDGLKLLCHYNSDLFSKKSILKWLNTLQLLINNVYDNDNCLLTPSPASQNLKQSTNSTNNNNSGYEHNFQNNFEHALIQIWADVLKIPKVGLDDNFFDLGGHSILLAEVQQKINSQYEKSVSMTELFQHPTVRLMAQHLSDNKISAQNSSLSDARKSGKQQRQFFQESNDT